MANLFVDNTLLGSGQERILRRRPWRRDGLQVYDVEGKCVLCLTSLTVRPASEIELTGDLIVEAMNAMSD